MKHAQNGENIFTNKSHALEAASTFSPKFSCPPSAMRALASQCQSSTIVESTFSSNSSVFCVDGICQRAGVRTKHDREEAGCASDSGDPTIEVGRSFKQSMILLTAKANPKTRCVCTWWASYRICG